MAKRDYYQVLGVSKGASDADLKSAYRKLAVQYHPDKNRGDKASEDKFKEISEAYDILRDAQKRAAYDRYGHAAFAGGTGASAGGGQRPNGSAGFGGFSDIFEEMFGDRQQRGGRSRQRRQERGSDQRFNLTISLEDAFRGRNLDLNLPSRVQCGDCHGSGAGEGSAPSSCAACGGSGSVRFQQGFFAMEQTCQHCGGRGVRIENPCGVCRGQGWVEKQKKITLNIPAGIDSGQRLRLAGKGNADKRGAAAGDLYIFIEITPHDLFEREGDDLVCLLPVAMASAALGEDIEVPTIEGGKARLKIPAGTQNGQILRLRGKGMPVLNSGGRRGDMYLNSQIEIPQDLSDRQIELLKEFVKESKNRNQHPKSGNFFEKVKDFF